LCGCCETCWLYFKGVLEEGNGTHGIHTGYTHTTGDQSGDGVHTEYTHTTGDQSGEEERLSHVRGQAARGDREVAEMKQIKLQIEDRLGDESTN